MTETFSLSAELREHLGSKSSAKIRQQGKLPVVVYGHKQEPVNIAVNCHEFIEALHHGNRVFNVNIEGKDETLLLKNLQYDYLGKDVIHADLVRVNLSEKVVVSVPIETKGVAAGAAEGGIVDEVLSKLEVECIVTSIPESIAVSVKSLVVGQSIHAGEIKLPEGVVLITDPENVVLTCHIVAAKVSEEDAEAAEAAEEASAEPEVITAKKSEEDAKE